MVVHPTTNDLSEPSSRLAWVSMSTLAKFEFYRCELRAHPLGNTDSTHREPSVGSSNAALMCKPQEVESLGATLPMLPTKCGSKRAKLYQPGLGVVKL